MTKNLWVNSDVIWYIIKHQFSESGFQKMTHLSQWTCQYLSQSISAKFSSFQQGSGVRCNPHAPHSGWVKQTLHANRKKGHVGQISPIHASQWFQSMISMTNWFQSIWRNSFPFHPEKKSSIQHHYLELIIILLSSSSGPFRKKPPSHHHGHLDYSRSDFSRAALIVALLPGRSKRGNFWVSGFGHKNGGWWFGRRKVW